MKAVAKTRPEPGIEIIEVEEPKIRPGCVKIQVDRASVCGTDLHIYNWDAWSSSRIKPTRIIGHEFCGTIVETGEGVTDRNVGDFVSSESHIVDGSCRLCKLDQAHLCENTSILGVDVDGGFAPFAVIPAMNARPTPTVVPKTVASMQDAIGNAVHTVMDGPVEAQNILITGLGPIGLFAVAICKVLGARNVFATEISPYRIELAKQLGVDHVFNPIETDVNRELAKLAPSGIDGTLEMSGHPSALDLAIAATRPGGRISLLGLYGKSLSATDINSVIFKGIRVQGIVGRKLWETWDQMHWLFTEKGLDLSSIVTHEMHFTEIEKAMKTLAAGEAGKIVLSFD